METTSMEQTIEAVSEIAEETIEEGLMPISLVMGGVCLILLICYLLFFLSAKGKSKGMYDDYIEPLDDKKHKLKKFIPIGLYINMEMDLKRFIPKSMLGIIGRKALEEKQMILELREPKYADYYYNIFNAEKKVTVLFVMIAMSGLGLIMCAQNDANTGIVFGVGSIVAGIAVNFMYSYTMKKKIEERHTLIRMEFPEFVNKLVLLVNAGMTVGRAWEKIVKDNKKSSPLQDEIKIAYINMQNGTPEAYAIEQFGRRCKTKEIMKFTSVLISNLRKGGSEIVPILIQQSNECWEMRKDAAKELGATAGVKMMLPMVLMLFAIIVVVGAPAVMQLRGS